MVEYKQTVKVPDDENAAINVFVNTEKGHTIYLSHTGTLVVVQDNKPKDDRVRAAGFAINQDNCAGCDGC